MQPQITQQTAQQTALPNAIERYSERIGFDFKPNKRFYDNVGINPKRYAQILRGEKRPTIDEARALANFFGIDVNRIF